MSESREALRQAYAVHFRGFDWDHFCTFTGENPADDDLVKRFLQTVRRLTRITQGPVEYLWVRERGAVAGTRHVHALLRGTGGMTPAHVERKWYRGIAHVNVYEPTRGGVYYLTKTMTAGDDERWDCSPGLGRSAVDRPSTARPEGANGPTARTWREDGLPHLPL